MKARTLVFLSVAAAIAGCAKPPVAEAPAPVQLPPHLGPPPSATCTVAPFHVADGGTAKISMTLSGDGGYCAAALTADNGKPFDAPLLHVIPQHGSARVPKYNGKTSVEYSSLPGYKGADSFQVRLVKAGVAGYTTLDVTVSVQ